MEIFFGWNRFRMKKLTQKCEIVLTLNDRSIISSGVSNKARPETTPALLISKVTWLVGEEREEEEDQGRKKLIFLVNFLLITDLFFFPYNLNVCLKSLKGILLVIYISEGHGRILIIWIHLWQLNVEFVIEMIIA